MERTGRWYIVRLELAIGVAATLFAVWAVAAASQPRLGSGNAVGLSIACAGAVGCVVGLTWMWRIFRAQPEAGTPPWRYRDRR